MWECMKVRVLTSVKPSLGFYKHLCAGVSEMATKDGGKKDKKKLLKREKKEKQKVSQMEKQAQLQKNKKQDSEMKEAFTESGSWKTGGHAR